PGHRPLPSAPPPPPDAVPPGDGKQGSDPWAVPSPFRKYFCRSPIVPHRSDQHSDERSHDKAAPAEPAGDPPRDKKHEAGLGRVDLHQRQEIRLPGEREVPPTGTLTDGDNHQRQ